MDLVSRKKEEKVEGPKNRAALYCRVSTEDQAKEGFSLGAQRERLEAYCLAKGWNVVNVYVDDGYSGRSDDRPAYRKMFEEKSEWDIVVVLKMDRIHRNSKNFTLMMERLRDWDKEFTSMQESFDTTTAMGRFVMDIIQRIAQLESEQIGERVYIGMMQKAKEGKGSLGFNIPFGYRMKDGMLDIVEKEAMIVKNMFSNYLLGMSLRKIEHDLEERKVPTKKGSMKWDPKTIKRILTNPIYCGYHRWDGIVYPSNARTIIDIRTFNEVQGRLVREGLPLILEENGTNKISSLA